MQYASLPLVLACALGCGSDFSTVSAPLGSVGGSTSSDAIVSSAGGGAAGLATAANHRGGQGHLGGGASGFGWTAGNAGVTSWGNSAGSASSATPGGGAGSASTATPGGGAGSASTAAPGGNASSAGSPASGLSPCGLIRSDEDSADLEICIPRGTFVMGSQSANLGGAHADHTPPHRVTLSTFVIDAFEVTIGRYRACVAAGHCSAPAADPSRGCVYDSTVGEADDLPVNCVTALQAEQFCAWDGARRLPTEAEWERTARGADERTYPWGAQFACGNAVAAANAACAGIHRGIANVGSLPTGNSPDGARDMAGNVAEWLQDFAAAYPIDAVTDPTGPSFGVSRILRGGSFSSNSPDARAFVRVTTTASAIGAIGFRCARSVRE